MYGSRKPPEEPPCDTCRVDVLPENEPALQVYLLTGNQYIMGYNGPIAINHIPVWEAIDRLQVKNPVKVFNQVVRCSQAVISDMYKGKDE